MVSWPPTRYIPSPATGYTTNPGATRRVSELGTATRINPVNGLVQINNELVESLAQQGTRILPELGQLLSTSVYRLQLIEGLYLAQRLAEKKTPGVNQLYANTSRFHFATDPLLQVYLAGFYRHIDEPAAYGPMMEMMLRHSQRPAWERQQEIQQTGINAVEEIGGTLLSQLARQSSKLNTLY